MGLHPKIQRRLMDVIRNVSRNDNKQFIMTPHSGTILDSVCLSSRIFIEKNNRGDKLFRVLVLMLHYRKWILNPIL